MEYRPEFEKRIQQGKNDTDPQHDIMKLAIDKVNAKGKYLYFVPRDDGKYEFCSNDPSIQAQIQAYKTQVLNKKSQGFLVLNRVKSDLGMMNEQPQSSMQTDHVEAKVPFIQSRLAKALKASNKQDLQTLNQLCLRQGYDLLWQDPMTYPAPHSNPTFDGDLILYDKKSGKDYYFTSERCLSKKDVQRSICEQIFAGAHSRSNTLGEPTAEQFARVAESQAERRRAEEKKLREENEKIIAEQNRRRAHQIDLEEKKQHLIKSLKQNKTDVEAFKAFEDSLGNINKTQDSTLIFGALDNIMKEHPETAEPLTKTFIGAHGFSLGERLLFSSPSEEFFKDHPNCLKYVQKEFDAFIEPYKQRIAQWKAIDELAPTEAFELDINDGWQTARANHHVIDSSSKWRTALSSKEWRELDVLRDENGKKIDEKNNIAINKKIADSFGINLYQETVPTEEQKQRAQKLVDDYKEFKEIQNMQCSNQEKIRMLRVKKFRSFISENSLSGEASIKDVTEAINKMEVVSRPQGYSSDREYLFKNEKGQEYTLGLFFEDDDKALTVQFGPFSFSSKLTSPVKDYDCNDGAINRVFEHELKQNVSKAHMDNPHAYDAIVIDAALRKVGILGHPSTIKKKIKEGQLEPMDFALSARERKKLEY